MKLEAPFQVLVKADISGILERTAKTSGKVFGILSKTAEKEPSTLDNFRELLATLELSGFVSTAAGWRADCE